MESLSKAQFTAVAAGLGCAALMGALLLGSEAEGKKKGGGGARVTSTSQAAILEAGAVSLEGVKGKVVVRALDGGTVLGKVATYKAKQGSSGKPKKSAGAARAGAAPLSDQGKQLLAGCAADTLSAQTLSRKKNGKKSKRTTTAALDLDLGKCSVPSENPVAKPYKGDPIPTANSDRCDFLDPAVCLQPWPNDYFTVADSGTDTGRRLDFDQASMPANKIGQPIEVDDYLRADGYSPGNMIVVKVPQVQTQAAFDNSGIVPINNLRAYDDDNQPVVVINAETGERHPVWAEVDANPLIPGKSGDPANSNLIIRPVRNFDEGARYIVALRNLKDAQGNAVEPPLPFRVYRDRLITQQTPVESRRAHMEDLISTLQQNGFQRSNLYMTWDFTVASEDSLTGRAVDMRDDALLRIGDDVAGDPITGSGDSTPGDGVVDGDAPEFTITGTSDPDGPGGNVLRQVDGELTNVPCYLDQATCPPFARFSFAPGADDPTLAPTSFARDPGASFGVRFRCIIPESVDDDGGAVVPAKPGTYGHGLLGEYTQVNGQSRLAKQQNSVWCATNWAGFSEDDVPVVSSSLVDLSNFHRMVDRMQQGFVNFHYLGRAMLHPDGFNSDAAFQVDAGSGLESVIDTSHLYFEGISQGAIMGGALTALSPDIERSVVNVNGMNYSTLLRRSVDFDEYAELPDFGLYAWYPNELERPLVLSMMQLLWDRGETNGYAHHITSDPLENTNAKPMLMQAAVGDHQVSNITAEVEARTIGASIYKPALDPGRHWESNPFMQIPGIDFGSPSSPTPFTGSALVYYDGGPTSYFNDGVGEAVIECTNNPLSTVPLTNTCQGSGVLPREEVPPRPQNGFGEDPHGYPRRSVDGLGHIEQFLDPNGFILPCTDPGPVLRPCYANGWTGP